MAKFLVTSQMPSLGVLALHLGHCLGHLGHLHLGPTSRWAKHVGEKLHYDEL